MNRRSRSPVPPQNPEIIDEFQLFHLNKSYNESSRPKYEKIRRIAGRLILSHEQVQEWFENRRQQDGEIQHNRSRRFTDIQRSALNNRFRVGRRPSSIEMTALADRIGLTMEQVKNWFRNRRADERDYRWTHPIQRNAHKEGNIDWEFMTKDKFGLEPIVEVNCLYNGKESNFWSINANILIDLVPETGDAKTFEFEHSFNKYSLGLRLGEFVNDRIFVPKIGIEVWQYVGESNREGRTKVAGDANVMLYGSIQIQSSVGIMYIPLDFKTPKNSDSEVVLHIGADKLYIDRYALMLCSPVFREMLSSDPHELHLKHFSKFPTFLQLLSNQPNLVTLENIEDLMEIASEYEIGFLAAECEDFLISTAPKTPSQKLYYSEMFGFSRLQEKVLEQLTMAEIDGFVESWRKKDGLSYQALLARKSKTEEISKKYRRNREDKK